MARRLCKPILGLALLALALAPMAARASAWLSPGEPLTERHLLALVMPALPPGERFDVACTQPALPVRNPASSEAHLQLLELRHDARTDRFTGSFLVRLETGEQRVLGLAGRAEALVEVLVPVRAIAAGERLEAGLLEPLVVAGRRLRADTLIDDSEIIGAEARRRLLAGRPLRQGDVQEPRLVRRGEAVELVYRAPGIEP
jgi:flagella basal body P-ring formation protein FlgA